MNLKVSLIILALSLSACQNAPVGNNVFDESCDPQGEGGSGLTLTPPKAKPLIHMVMSKHSDAPSADAVFQMHAVCPEGEQLISGGCQWWDTSGQNPPLPLIDGPGSISYNEPYVPDEWICQGAARADTNRIWAYAICMK